jgi:hypothetical protein
MQQNLLKVTINCPVEVVFEFTTNPSKTRLWVPSILEELASEFPPKNGTEYRNRGSDNNWSYYQVTEYIFNKIFTLTSQDKNYHVRYTYNSIDAQTTEMVYYEWMEKGQLENPFKQEILEELKNKLEK